MPREDEIPKVLRGLGPVSQRTVTVPFTIHRQATTHHTEYITSGTDITSGTALGHRLGLGAFA